MCIILSNQLIQIHILYLSNAVCAIFLEDGMCANGTTVLLQRILHASGGSLSKRK